MSLPLIRLALVLPLMTLSAARAAEASSVAFVGVTVIDVVAGKPVPGQTVVVANGRIAEVGPAGTVQVPAGVTEVKASGKFLIPGLWDMHTHIADGTYCQLFLANGITGVREMHAFFPPMILGLRDSVKAGKRLGPRIVAAGALVDGPQLVWPGSIKATTPDEGRAAVRRLKEMKADFVKVYSSLTQRHRQAEPGRFSDDPVRRRRGRPELPVHHARLELSGADVPPAKRNPQRRLEVPGGPAGEVTEQ